MRVRVLAHVYIYVRAKMNDADKHFGPKPAVAMPPARRNLNNWSSRCPQLWGILDAFKEEYPNLIVTARDRTTNYAAAKEIFQIVGEKDGPEFVRRAARHSSSNDLAVGNIYSLIYYREIWFGGKDSDSEKSRQRYVTGKYKDFWGNGDDDD